MKQIIKNALIKRGWIKKSYSKNNLELLLEYALATCLQKKDKYRKSPFVIVQIGANDGKTGDPLYKFISANLDNIEVTFYEPQKEAFEKLKQNYPVKHFKFINCAVGGNGIKTFYKFNLEYRKLIKKITGNDVGDLTNSLEKSNLIKRMEKNGITDFDKYIDREDIRVVELPFDKIHFLQVDCEGYDDEVIYHSNVKITQPDIINFEYKNLSKERLANLIEFLKNYKTFKRDKTDMIAIRR